MNGQDYLPGLEGEQRRADLSQWYTPPWLAEAIASWALEAHPEVRSVIDPAAGHGALLVPFVRRNGRYGISRTLRAWDIDPRNVEVLRSIPGVHAIGADFRTMYPTAKVDLAVVNPPYEDGGDVDGVLAALRAAHAVVALLRSVSRHGLDRWERLWSRVTVLREVVLVGRPDFGGDFTPKADFAVFELMERVRPLERGEPAPPHPVEWW